MVLKIFYLSEIRMCLTDAAKSTEKIAHAIFPFVLHNKIFLPAGHIPIIPTPGVIIAAIHHLCGYTNGCPPSNMGRQNNHSWHNRQSIH